MPDPDDRDDYAYREGRSFKYKLLIRVGAVLSIEYWVEMTCSFRFVLTIETNKTDIENGGWRF